MSYVTTRIENWKPTAAPYAVVGIGNRRFMPYSVVDPTKTWALAGTDDAIRFEVRPGDRTPYDIAHDPTPKERSEIGILDRYGDAVPVDISWTLDLDAPATLTSLWTCCGQMHQDGWSGPPPIALWVVKGNRWQLCVRAAGVADRFVYVGTMAPSTRFRLRVVGGANGRVTLWMDDLVVADLPGPVGGPQGGFYWKLGIYRHSATEIVAATYRGLRIATGDMTEETQRPRIFAKDGKIWITAPAHSRVNVYENGRRIAGPVAVGWSGRVAPSIPTGPGILYLSAGGNELTVAIGAANDLWPLMDQLAAMSGLAAVHVTDAPTIFDVPAATDLPATIARFAKPLALVGSLRFRKTAHPSPTSTRIDFFDARGAKIVA